MRIGIYDPYLDDIGGGEKYMVTIASCLANKHDVSIFWDNEKDFQEVARRFGIETVNISLVKNIFSPTMNTFERMTQSKKYDALIILSDGSIPVTLCKKVYLHVQQPLQVFHKRTFKDTLKMKFISKVFYNSHFTANYNQNFFPGVQSTVIYPPVNQIHLKIPKKNNILHVGRYRRKGENDDFKKQHIMIEAFKSMIDDGLKDWNFVLVAALQKKDEESFLKLQKSIEGYPVKIITNVSWEELEKIYASAKIYWHASGYNEDLQKHPEFAEHFGISTVEAMSAGAVPVVINAGGQKEIVTDEKDGLLWNKLDELKQKTKRVINNSQLWEQLSKNAIENANQYNEEKFSLAVHNLIRD